MSLIPRLNSYSILSITTASISFHPKLVVPTFPTHFVFFFSFKAKAFFSSFGFAFVIRAICCKTICFTTQSIHFLPLSFYLSFFHIIWFFPPFLRGLKSLLYHFSFPIMHQQLVFFPFPSPSLQFRSSLRRY